MTATRRRLAAILAADVAGYSRLMGQDEEGTHERLQAHLRELVEPKIKEHRGRIVKKTGDGMLAEFSSVVDAVRYAAEVQRGMIDREPDVLQERRIRFRIGVNLGDVMVEEHDIFGDGVNVAARLEALAEPGGVCISRMVRDQVRDKLPYPFEDMGEQSVKNIARPIRAYALSAAAVEALPPVAALTARPKVNRRRPGPLRGTPRLSFVVLPFVNLGADPDQEYFCDAITYDLTTDLSRISGSFVIARNTAFTYKAKPVDVKQIGRELSVCFVIEGSVRRSGNQVQVNVQLIDASSGAHVWADRFDTDRRNLAEAQSEITGRLARSLNVELVRDVGRRIEQEPQVNPDAGDLVMRGWALHNRPRSLANSQEAQRTLEWALDLDPRLIDARIGLATVLGVAISNGMSSCVQQDEAHVERLLLEALERDTNRSTAHYAMGVLRRNQNRFAEARIEFEAAITLDHNDAFAMYQLGNILRYLGQPEAAIPYVEKAIRLNPRDPNIGLFYMGLGCCHLLLGHVDPAVDLLRKARAANPRFWAIQLFLAGALGLVGDLDEVRVALGESLKLKPEVNSLARLRSYLPFLTHSQHQALADKTLHAGLHPAGFPDE